MEGRLAEELYAESLQLSKIELTSTSADDQENKANDCDGDDLSLWDGSDGKLDSSSDLDREWQRRHDQFHTIGYRDGLIAGKEASAQEGFNIGFKRSVLDGYSWGVVRGVTSAFSHLPHQLKERLIETHEKRGEFQGLYELVHSLSTTDALKLFSEEIKAQEALEQSEHLEVNHHTAGLQEQPSHGSQLRSYRGQLESLIRDSPSIDIPLPEPK
ncbi:Yae1 domain-containing protein 1 [Spatholobus suberectus]|nr:Yae1 domain-containing protein 1 [Spatholobus suberectus]